MLYNGSMLSVKIKLLNNWFALLSEIKNNEKQVEGVMRKYWSKCFATVFFMLLFTSVGFSEEFGMTSFETGYANGPLSDKFGIMHLNTGPKINVKENEFILKGNIFNPEDYAIMPEYVSPLPDSDPIFYHQPWSIAASAIDVSSSEEEPLISLGSEAVSVSEIKKEIRELRELIEKHSQVILALHTELEELKQKVSHE